MREITFELFEEQEKLSPGRRCFLRNSGVQKNKKPGSCMSFSVPYKESIALIYEAMTSCSLRANPKFNNYWHPLRSEDDVFKVEEWEQQQGTRVFLRDCLSCSIALDVNMKDVTTGDRTELGKLEYNAKTNDAEAAIESLAEHLAAAIADLPLYKSTTLIAAVPARPGKTTRDLPTELAKRIAEKRKLTDLTAHFQYAGVREQLKALPLVERWAAWEGALLSLADEGKALLTGSPVILIDDKYQSGVSVNYVAMILQQAGASDVYGLYAVKTMRDTDNTGNG